MVSSIYQRFTYWFAPLLFSVFVLSYQNCSDVGFRRIGGNEGPGIGLACLPADFDLNMSVSTVIANQPVTFSVDPVAPITTYTWTLNGEDIGTGPSITRTFTEDGSYSMRVTAMKDDCENPRSKTENFTINSAPVCNLDALALTGDSWGRVDEMLDYIVNHNCLDLTFGWNAGDGTVVTNTNNEMQHAWESPGVFVVSTDVIDGANQQRLSMPVTIQAACPALGDLFVSAPDVAYVNQVVPFDIVIPGCLNIASINWSFGANSSPSTSNTKQTQTTYSSPGVRTVNVVVTDADGNSVTLPHRITILSTTVPPCDEEALLTLTGPTSANINETLRFGVYVPSCIQATAFTWNFDDGTGGSGNPVNKAYPTAGVYTVSVIVTTVNHGFITLSRRVVIHSPISYSWVLGEWGACVGLCGQQGTQTRAYECRDNNGNVVSPNLCSGSQPPSETRSCQIPVGSCICPSGQVNDGTGVCVPADGLCAVPPPGILRLPGQTRGMPAPCSQGTPNPNFNSIDPGQTITYSCVGGESVQSGCRMERCQINEVVENGVCVAVATYSWVESWSNCAGACGTNAGTQTSSYQCVDSNGSVVKDALCTTPKPASQTRACTVAPNACTCTPPQINVGGVCVDPPPTYSWQYGSYGACTGACGNNAGTQTRYAQCVDSNGVVVADSFCTTPKPAPQSQACTVRQCNSCSLGGVTVAHGATRNFFSASSVACGQTCQSQPRTCNDGALSGDNSYANSSCTVAPCTYSWDIGAWSACSATACGTSGTQTRTVTCRRGDGTVVADNQCINNGAGPKPATSQSCSARACNSCSLDGVTVPHNSSRAFYTAAVVACGQTCQSQVRACTDGVLSGNASYASANCNIGTCSYQWITGSWSSCSATTCGADGVQTRSVYCQRGDGTVVADSQCTNNGAGPKPASSQACTGSGNSCTCPAGTTKVNNQCVALGFSGTYCDRSDGYIKQFWDLWDGRVSPPVNNPNTNAFPHAQYTNPVSQLMTLSVSGFNPGTWGSTSSGFTRFTGLRCNVSSTPHIRNDCNYVTNRHNYNSALSQISTVDRNIGSDQQCQCQPGQVGTGTGCIAPAAVPPTLSCVNTRLSGGPAYAAGQMTSLDGGYGRSGTGTKTVCTARFYTASNNQICEGNSCTPAAVTNQGDGSYLYTSTYYGYSIQSPVTSTFKAKDGNGLLSSAVTLGYDGQHPHGRCWVGSSSPVSFESGGTLNVSAGQAITCHTYVHNNPAPTICLNGSCSNTGWVRSGPFNPANCSSGIGSSTLPACYVYTRTIAASDAGKAISLKDGRDYSTESSISLNVAAAAPQNAACGTAHQQFAIAASFPGGSLCSSGTAPMMTPPSLFAPNYRSEWICQGVNGGSNANCVAYGYNVGNCASTFGNCIDGTPGNLNATARTWTCKGAKGPSNPELPSSHPGYSSHVRQCSL